MGLPLILVNFKLNVLLKAVGGDDDDVRGRREQ